ncbi:iron-containing alcohol dehydrogenase [Tropicimonas sp. IMCC34043]|uniref:iron-containing alcohol dehydrogenase n=1 Tax=Tropicimonas sp. IMCC34043 TaxID=2248760 RepID=UPI000E262494|nr:iron-containing alcohol dehydrogenase [Tropicimonas sp. IMCC34043]
MAHLVESFTLTVQPARIVFGVGTLARLPEELSRMGARRVLVLSSPFQTEQAGAVAAMLGPQ